jgi:hypothetical protein
MDGLSPCGGGRAVQTRSVVACLITPDPTGRPSTQVRPVGTMTVDRLDRAAWLRAAG